ncbi:T9SS type A sorting domain-containing protein [Williamwhitmania taraxaci]|uniref:Por secretion system C-terminal sorting domain-containing protein n=1 Tax=Williamwhitmania taraxaci TaxID=1640674 RepID=A0A1G6RG31_9BACT|nr:T9SS type A sorting domain-containing protein [Williamwhitmania taraxaci]SDD03401.1 Por secretion system C-terminal sorting domain-containing protein [Williamwhitmania taraxaci]
MKPTLLLSYFFLLSLLSLSTSGQQVVSTTGGSIVGASYTVTYTVGEVANTTLSGGGYILNQGFQQPSYTITSIEDNLPSAVLAVYPNPTNGIINVEMNDFLGKSLSYILYDFKGQEILRHSGQPGPIVKFEIDLSNFSEGIYLLKVLSDDRSIKVIRVVKN